MKFHLKDKICFICKIEKKTNEFTKDSSKKDSLRYCCKDCGKKHYIKYPKIYLLRTAKYRAKKMGIPFNITIEDFEIPKVCPVFKKLFVFGKGRQDFSISLDRINSSKGYEKGNIVIVSWRANHLKNDATLDELKALTNFYSEVKK